MSVTVEVCEPSDAADAIGSITARMGEFGPELCHAVGRELGQWYVSVHSIVTAAAGMGDDERVRFSCYRDEAERIVRLIAGLFESATGGQQ